MPVPVTEEEMRSPLYKYFERDIAPTPADIAERIMKEEFDPKAGLHPSNINDLLNDGYLPGEFGVYPLEDGGLMTANYTKMPGVTPEMFDWWFAWHGLNSLRYKIWDKDEHYFVQTQNIEQALDESLSMRERYQNTTHVIRESLMPGQPPVKVRLNFVPPTVVGFDPERLKSFNGTIVCTPGPSIMVHMFRATPDGGELRTRFFMGYVMKDGKPERLQGFPANPMGGRIMLMHNVKEFTHLAEILPELYAEFKDDFRVEPFSEIPKEAD